MRRTYLPFDPKHGYPRKPELSFECTECMGVLPTMPDEATACGCGNVAVDVDSGRVSVRDRTKVRAFSEN